MRSDIAIASPWSCVTHSAESCMRDDQLAQPGARLLAQLGVEIGQRLVQQDDGRVVDERAGERDALLLAAGELVRKALGEVPERQLLERRLHARRDVARRDLAKFQAVRDVVGHRLVRPQRVRLEHETEVAALRRARRGPRRRRTRPCRRCGSCRCCGCSRPATARSSVVLPLPEGPSSDDDFARGSSFIETPFRIGLSP